MFKKRLEVDDLTWNASMIFPNNVHPSVGNKTNSIVLVTNILFSNKNA